jgi:hypothetical protein
MGHKEEQNWYVKPTSYNIIWELSKQKNKNKKTLATQAAARHSLYQIGWQRFRLATESTKQENLHIRNKTHPDYSRYQNTLSVCISGTKIISLQLMVTFSKPCSTLQGNWWISREKAKA